MTRPAAVPYAGREKWGEALVDLLLAGGGVLLLAVAAPELDGVRPLALALLVGYTAWAVTVTLALTLAVVCARRLPELAEDSLDGRPAIVLRTWAAPWWHAVALDAGLAVLGVALAGMGLVSGGEWRVAAVLTGLAGCWFLGRVVLILLGRRRRPALWVTDSEVVVDSYGGRVRVARAAVKSARGVGRRLVLTIDGECHVMRAPRPWRPVRTDRDVLLLDCSDTAHRAGDVADWLMGEVSRPGKRRFESAPAGRDR